MTISVNQPAPDFELPSNQVDNGRPGKKVKLSDFRGKPVVLAFYPLDFSPVCTKENVCFRDDLKQFEQLGAQVLGISVDSVWTHDAFAKSLQLPRAWSTTKAVDQKTDLVVVGHVAIVQKPGRQEKRRGNTSGQQQWSHDFRHFAEAIVERETERVTR